MPWDGTIALPRLYAQNNVTPTAACPQVMGSGSPTGAVVGTFIGTTLLYTMILIVSICALIYWNKKHR